MSDKRGIFFDEWQACLRAHYKYVIQDGDTVTEPTLRAVLLQSGLSEDELHALADDAHAETPPPRPPDTTPENDPEDESGDEADDETDDGQLALF